MKTILQDMDLNNPVLAPGLRVGVTGQDQGQGKGVWVWVWVRVRERAKVRARVGGRVRYLYG
jgi:hypothetical protein